MRWPKGLAYNNGGFHSTSSPWRSWRLQPPTPPARGGWGEHRETSLARPALNRVSHRVPKPGEPLFRHVSRFEPHRVLIPVSCPTGGLQVCLPLPKEVGDRKFSIPLPSHKLCFCLWEGGTPKKVPNSYRPYAYCSLHKAVDAQVQKGRLHGELVLETGV